MPQKSTTKNLSANSKTQFHQIGNLRGQQSNVPLSNQRVLILSTPITLKDGTVNMEQRAIPLRIDNTQLMVTAQENRSRLVSLKRDNKLTSSSSPLQTPAPALALPINKLNKKSPTVVKNEVGQVMGKIIPLGKFSNISTGSSTLPPISTVAASPTVSISAAKNMKPNTSKQNSKWGGYKLLKLDKDVIEASKIASEKFKEIMKSKQQSSGNNEADDKVKSVATVSQPIVKCSENNEEQLITVTDVRPKKQVHLVWKGFQNIASIGHTGTNIKLIPLENWKTDTKLNFVKTQTNTAITTQPKIVDVRSCGIEEIGDRDKSNCDYDREDFDIEIMLEKDPLDIDGISSEEAASFAQSLDGSALSNGTNSGMDLDLVERFHVPDETNLSSVDAKFESLNSSDVTSLMSSDRTDGPESICESRNESDLTEKKYVEVKTELDDSKCGKNVVRKVKEEVGSLAENELEDTEIESSAINCTDLYKRFQINEDDITLRETKMLSYICNLKEKLLQSQKIRVRGLAGLQKNEYLGFNNLSGIQKRFIKSQLRNSSRGSKKQRFTKTDMAMARDVLKATGPKGYNNLRKLFSLPSMSAVVRAMSKT